MDSANTLPQIYKEIERINNNVLVMIQNITSINVNFTQINNTVNSLDVSIYDMGNTVGDTFDTMAEKIQKVALSDFVGKIKEGAQALASFTMPALGFEQVKADFSAMSGISGQQLEELAKTARKTGTECGIGATEAMNAFKMLAENVDVKNFSTEGLSLLQESAIRLSQATGISMQEAVDSLTGAIKAFDAGAGDAERIINVMAASAQSGGAGIKELSSVFDMVGSQAINAGISMEELAAAVEVLGENNIKGAEAGNTLKNVINGLQNSASFDFTQMNLSQVLDELKPRLSDTNYLTEIFGSNNVEAAKQLINNSAAVAGMTEKLTGSNVAMEMAAIRTGTTQNALERCRAFVDNVKIGFFELTGSVGGYVAILAEQAGAVNEMIDLFSTCSSVVSFLTDAQQLQSMWTGIVSGAMKAWSVVQAVLNASLWACPITWIVAAVIALIAVIVLCVTKVQGWGKQWNSIVNFMKLSGQLFVETFKFSFNTLVDGIMIGIDHIKLGWYKFKKALGIGNSDENQRMINEIRGDIDQRKSNIEEGAKKIEDLKNQAKNALTWELSVKAKGEKDEVEDATAMANGLMSGKSNGQNFGPPSGIPAAGANVQNFSPQVASATTISPSTMEATSITYAGAPGLEYSAGYGQTAGGSGRGINMEKFCETLEINIANADDKGYEEIETEITNVLKRVFDNYEE